MMDMRSLVNLVLLVPEADAIRIRAGVELDDGVPEGPALVLRNLGYIASHAPPSPSRLTASQP